MAEKGNVLGFAFCVLRFAAFCVSRFAFRAGWGNRRGQCVSGRVRVFFAIQLFLLRLWDPGPIEQESGPVRGSYGYTAEYSSTDFRTKAGTLLEWYC